MCSGSTGAAGPADAGASIDTEAIKPTLVFFRWTDPNLPAFIKLHLEQQVSCLARWFRVVLVDHDCDYAEICDRYQPDLALFESGVYATARKITNTDANQDVPKLARGLRANPAGTQLRQVTERAPDGVPLHSGDLLVVLGPSAGRLSENDVTAARVVVLDGVETVHGHELFHLLADEPAFRLLVHDSSLANGYAIFRRSGT